MTLTIGQKLDNRERVGAKLQQQINETATHDYREALHCLRFSAETRTAEFPQYNGKWDNAVLVRLKKQVRTKGGLQFGKGDITIAYNDHSQSDYPWTAYSLRTGYSVALDTGHIELAPSTPQI